MQGILEYLHATSDAGVAIRPLDLSNAAVLMYGGSSFANAPACKSQQGLLGCLTENTVKEHDMPASVIDWKSNRPQRVHRSTLSTEAGACDNAVDHGVYTARFVGEVITGYPARERRSSLPLLVATDGR